MATPSKEARDARLDDLAAAVAEWADRRQKSLDAQVSLSKRMLKGRTGAERLSASTTAQAASLTVDELDQFLTGE